MILDKKKIINLSDRSTQSSEESSGENSGEKGQDKPKGTPTSSSGKPGSDLEKIFSQFEASVGMLDEEIIKAADEKYESEDPNKEIKPPPNTSRTSYYDENGKFKSSYSGEEVPSDFLTKKEYFTDPKKMRDDMYFKMDKMAWDMESERKEFERTHDEHGKDREAYKKLKDDHKKMKIKMMNVNHETWRELKREVYESDSELR